MAKKLGWEQAFMVKVILSIALSILFALFVLASVALGVSVHRDGAPRSSAIAYISSTSEVSNPSGDDASGSGTDFPDRCDADAPEVGEMLQASGVAQAR